MMIIFLESYFYFENKKYNILKDLSSIENDFGTTFIIMLIIFLIFLLNIHFYIYQ